MTTRFTPAAAGRAAQSGSGARATKSLLACGIVAGPGYVIVSLGQAFTRTGFDPSRHEWSLLVNGRFGWIQIANLLLAGLLTVAAAVGVRRAARDGAGSTWGPRMLGVYGAGVASASFFFADPTDGFPPGTPKGMNHDVSWHGWLHLLCGGLGFIGLTAACLLLARWFTSAGERNWAIYSRVTGIAFLAAFVGIATGSGNRVTNLAFTAAVIAGSVWIAAVSSHLYRREPVSG